MNSASGKLGKHGEGKHGYVNVDKAKANFPCGEASTAKNIKRTI